MHEHTFSLCAPFSCSQLLEVVVCAAVTADTAFIMTRPQGCCFLSGMSRQKGVCRRCDMWHVHTGNRWALLEPWDGLQSRRGCTAAYQTQLRRSPARWLDA